MLPVSTLMKMLNSNGITAQNIGKDFSDGKCLTDLMKKLDPTTFGTCADVDAVLAKLQEVIPESAFMTKKELGN